MQSWVDTKDPRAVEHAVLELHGKMFGREAAPAMQQAFGWARDCFEGRYPGYQAIDARYHDFEHTLQGTLCLARLLWGYFRAGHSPVLTQRDFELAILAVLLHDTGYLKPTGDHEGTGAKFTLVHVSRSAEFAAELLRPRGYSAAEIAAVQRMIRCTGVNADMGAIAFASGLERTLGSALATADLLGQMAAPDYIDKLGILYEEFSEAMRHRPPGQQLAKPFTSADDLRRQTPAFWERYVLTKINKDFGAVYEYLRVPWPEGPNPYIDAIEANIARLRAELNATA
jgi:hypothetical protein